MNDKNQLETLDRLSRMKNRLDQVFESSPLVKSLQYLATTSGRLKLGRTLTTQEISKLESQGNESPDWSRVRTLSEFNLETVSHNFFSGDILFSGFAGEFKDAQGQLWAAGIFNCRVHNSIIGNTALSQIANLNAQVIEDGAILVNVGSLICTKPTRFSFGNTIHPGMETGERSIWIWDELTLSDCEDAIGLRLKEQEKFSAYFHEKLSRANVHGLNSHFGYVGKGVEIFNTRQIQNSWIGNYTKINGASLIRESALLSSLNSPVTIETDAYIDGSLLEGGTAVASAGKVSQSILLSDLLCDLRNDKLTATSSTDISNSISHAASVTLGGTVVQSVIGPATQVSKGEINASLVGPMVGFHHQALLISALWPEGRGNIAYGANVGSNHTGKKPDQEIKPGEGTFFGLGCTIKFPSNFSDAPYSLIAAGLITAPQRLVFPFSLLSQNQSGAHPSLNEIIPGWMWSENAYSLVRRSYKFSNQFLQGCLFTPLMVEKVLIAFHALLNASKQWGAPSSSKGFAKTEVNPSENTVAKTYLEKDIPGLGKNFLTGENINQAIESYTDYLIFFLLQNILAPKEVSDVSSQKSMVPQVIEGLLLRDLPIPQGDDQKTFLKAEAHRIAAFSKKITVALTRDQKRGSAIFPDYDDFHSSATEDKIVLRLMADLKTLTDQLSSL